MLGGHFITEVMDPESAKLNPYLYAFWQFIRSHTAALFFMISCVVVTYLLVRDPSLGLFENPRVGKSYKRGLKLLLIGFLLHLDLTHLLKGHLSSYLFTFHVLQCIATFLIVIVTLYVLHKLLKFIPLEWMLGAAFIFSFVGRPLLSHINTEGVPHILLNILGVHWEGQRFTSAFPIFPWLGYGFAGGVLGALLAKNPQWVKSKKLGWYMILTGTLFQFVPFLVLLLLYAISQQFQWIPFIETGYEFTRFGRVFMIAGAVAVVLKNRDVIRHFFRKYFGFARELRWILPFSMLCLLIVCAGHFHLLPDSVYTTVTIRAAHIGLFLSMVALAVKYIPWNYDLFLKTGQFTLPIYAFHVIILYGGLTGIGIDTWLTHRLGPWTSIFLAAGFIALFVYFVKYIEVFYWSNLVQRFRRTKT